jgi:anti-sigma B factor antagonist
VEGGLVQTVSINVGRDGVLDVVLRGEVDFTKAAPTVDVVRESIADLRPNVVRVDLEAVTFLDSSGIGVLIQAMKAAVAIGAAFRVEEPNDQVFDQLGISGLLEPFGLTASPAHD